MKDAILGGENDLIFKERMESVKNMDKSATEMETIQDTNDLYVTLNTGSHSVINPNICPICGAFLQQICYTVIPPIYETKCLKCGYVQPKITSNLDLKKTQIKLKHPLKIRIKYFEGATHLKRIQCGNWIDVYANKDVFVSVGERAMIPLGFALELPQGWEGHLAPRSSTFKTWGIIQTNSVGVVDDTYIGDNDQWHMPVYCLKPQAGFGKYGECGTWIHRGDKIGQFRIMEVMPEIEFEEVESFGNADRGGFGTTGTV